MYREREIGSISVFNLSDSEPAGELAEAVQDFLDRKEEAYYRTPYRTLYNYDNNNDNDNSKRTTTTTTTTTNDDDNNHNNNKPDWGPKWNLWQVCGVMRRLLALHELMRRCLSRC